MRMFRRRARNEYEDDATQTTATTTTSERRAYVQNGAEPAPVRAREVRAWGIGRCEDLVEELRGAVAGSKLDLQPWPDLGDHGAGSVTAEERGCLLPAVGDRREALRQRREVAGEQREQGVAKGGDAGGPPLPDAEGVGAEDPEVDVVELEVALESRLRAQAVRIEGLERSHVGAILHGIAEDPLP